MANLEYVQEVREKRDEPTVLKTRILTARSFNKEDPIIVFEGETDIPAYRAWLSRINHDFKFLCVTSSGKKQIISFLKKNFHRDTRFQAVYFVVDRDFDYLQGIEKPAELYCTDRYSVENYFADPHLIESILIEDLLLYEDGGLVQVLTEAFSKDIASFHSAMGEPNLFLYIAAQEKIGRGNVPKRSTPFVTIEVGNISAAYNPELLADLLTLARRPNQQEIEKYSPEFAKMNQPTLHYRGKFIFHFVRSWLDKLAALGRAGLGPFTNKRTILFNSQNLGFRSLASRSSVPEGLADFVNYMMTASPPGRLI